MQIELALIKAEASDSQDKLNIDMAKMQQNLSLSKESWISSNRL